MVDIDQAAFLAGLSKLSRSFGSHEPRIPYESNLNKIITDVTSSGTKKKPMLSDQITCMPNQYNKESKDLVIDDARKTYQLCVPISSYRLRTKSVRKYKHAGCDDTVPCSILCKNALSLHVFHKGKVIKNYIVNNWRKLYQAPLNVESILSPPL